MRVMRPLHSITNQRAICYTIIKYILKNLIFLPQTFVCVGLEVEYNLFPQSVENSLTLITRRSQAVRAIKFT